MPFTILVLSNEPAIRELLHELLVDEGYQVESYSYDAYPLEAIQRRAPDLLILDEMFPLGGLSTPWKQYMEAWCATPPCSLLLCTVSPREVQATLSFAPYLQAILKPFDLEDLLQAVHSLLSSPVR